MRRFVNNLKQGQDKPLCSFFPRSRLAFVGAESEIALDTLDRLWDMICSHLAVFQCLTLEELSFWHHRRTMSWPEASSSISACTARGPGFQMRSSRGSIGHRAPRTFLSSWKGSLVRQWLVEGSRNLSGLRYSNSFLLLLVRHRLLLARHLFLIASCYYGRAREVNRI